MEPEFWKSYTMEGARQYVKENKDDQQKMADIRYTMRSFLKI